ncbi:hypothetical protein BC332_09504 [Capsicum chinense]|nr:hypothetical protein BC332_09504 [Capsicum chinense]
MGFPRKLLYCIATPEWKKVVSSSLSPLGEGAVGALYLWAKLPDKYVDEFTAVHWLAKRHGAVLIPGSSSGCPGFVRISFGGLIEKDCIVAAERLGKGLEELVEWIHDFVRVKLIFIQLN